MSIVDVSKYAEVANDAANVLQDIMYSHTSGPVAKAIAASVLLHHCEAIVRSEHFKAKSRSKKRSTDVNVQFQTTAETDPNVIAENIRKFGMNVEEAIKFGRAMY